MGENDPTLKLQNKEEDMITTMTQFIERQRAMAGYATSRRRESIERKVMAEILSPAILEQRIETIEKAKRILSTIVANKDQIIPSLQQPSSGNWLPLEPEYQAQFLELIMKAARSKLELINGIDSLKWANEFKDHPQMWDDSLVPLVRALASSNRLHKSLCNVRELMAELQDTVKKSNA